MAVLAADGRPLSYSAMGALAADLSAVLFVEVDVGDLATPDAVFRYEVARSGRTIFEGRAGARTAFVAKALIDYSDIQRFLPALVEGVARRARREAERRLAGRSA